MANIEEMIREVLSEQKVQNEKIDGITETQKIHTKDLRQVRDSTIRFEEKWKSHDKTHSWIHKGLYAVASLVGLGIIAAGLKAIGLI